MCRLTFMNHINATRAQQPQSCRENGVFQTSKLPGIFLHGDLHANRHFQHKVDEYGQDHFLPRYE